MGVNFCETRNGREKLVCNENCCLTFVFYLNFFLTSNINKNFKQGNKSNRWVVWMMKEN